MTVASSQRALQMFAFVAYEKLQRVIYKFSHSLSAEISIALWMIAAFLPERFAKCSHKVSEKIYKYLFANFALPEHEHLQNSLDVSHTGSAIHSGRAKICKELFANFCIH